MVWKATAAMRTALDAVIAERQRQDAKWGEQNHRIAPPHGRRGWFFPHVIGNTALAMLGLPTEKAARVACNEAVTAGRVTYGHILVEEVCELIYAAARDGDTSDAARAEAVQVAAVALAIVECIDRKRETGR